MKTLNKKGFTLIELLIVIGIIGILAGIIIAVINPAQQRTKANQAVIRSTVEKICLAAVACANASTTGHCTDTTPLTLGVSGIANDAWNNLGPGGATYSATYTAGALTEIRGATTTPACTYYCSPEAVGDPMTPAPTAGCLVR